MSGDGAGAGDGEGEDAGHPGLSDSSAANTSGMAGPAGMGVDTSGTQSETVSFSPTRAGTVGFGHPGLSDAAAIGTQGMAGPLAEAGLGLLGMFAPDITDMVTGINPQGRDTSPPGVMGMMANASDPATGLAAFGINQSDASVSGQNGLLNRAPSLLPRQSQSSIPSSYAPPPRPQYEYGQGQWQGNQFLLPPIMRRA